MTEPRRWATRTTLAAAVAIAAGQGATAADWPQWRGPSRDGHAPAGAKLPASFPANPAV
ncbi:MAG: hypothetical protein JWO31_1899, partial [Phycisphaerales bacterium]|nr:hypothetical protein [Phycisphaerales bacterium]